MKQILIGMLIAVVLMVGVGTASALDLGYPIEDNQPGYECGDFLANVTIDGVNVTVELVTDSPYNAYLTDDTSIKSLGLSTTTALNVVSINGTSAGNPDAFGSFGTFNTNVGFAPNEKTTGPITITFDDNVELVPNNNGYTAAVHIIGLWNGEGAAGSNSAASLKLADGDCGNSQIPEFPTIALPIVAIIGLAFILQRREE